MSTEIDYRLSRSAYRRARTATKDFVDRQTTVLEHELLITKIMFRGFFLIGNLALVTINKENLLAAVPLFAMALYVWAFNIQIDFKRNSELITSAERMFFNESSRFGPRVADEEIEQEYIDELIRIQSEKSRRIPILYVEPVCLFVSSTAIIVVRLFFPAAAIV